LGRGGPRTAICARASGVKGKVFVAGRILAIRDQDLVSFKPKRRTEEIRRQGSCMPACYQRS
jgi:hypothetical protein